MDYRIFPSIGIARLGDSPDFFVGPEVLGSSGRERSDGAEVTRFKDQLKVRKQAARFHLFESSGDGNWAPANLPAGATVTWTVHVANKKDAIARPSLPPGPIAAGSQLRPSNDPARSARLITAKQSISAGGPVRLGGTHAGAPVTLGSMQVDGNGKLLVLAGDGVSASHPPGAPIGNEGGERGDSFYNNKDWHDDVGDGPVTADITFADGSAKSATGAWVIMAPPDFARAGASIVSLYDVIRDLAINENLLPAPGRPSFTRDIYPLLKRARSLRWTHGRKGLNGVRPDPNWSKVSDDYVTLSKATAAEATIRSDNATSVERVHDILRDFDIPQWQLVQLQAWMDAQFDSDWQGVPAPALTPTAESLTRAALEATAGQGFFPGIEGGRILTDVSIWQQPFDFRIAHAALEPGDVTALMAQPWQADFLECQKSWWPSQRPDIAPQADGSFALWHRPLQPDTGHRDMVAKVMKFGVVTTTVNAGGVEVGVEEGRDPNP